MAQLVARLFHKQEVKGSNPFKALFWGKLTGRACRFQICKVPSSSLGPGLFGSGSSGTGVAALRRLLIMAPAYLVTISIVENGVALSRQIWMRDLETVNFWRQRFEANAAENKFILTSYTYVFQEAPDVVFS